MAGLTDVLSLGQMPAPWCKSLINKGLRSDLLSLSSSVRSSLGPEVERILRVVLLISQSELPPEEQPPMFAQKAWVDKETLKFGALCYVDLLSVRDVTGLDAAREALKKNVLQTIYNTAESLDARKKDVQLAFAKITAVNKAFMSEDGQDTYVKLMREDDAVNDEWMQSNVKGGWGLARVRDPSESNLVRFKSDSSSRVVCYYFMLFYFLYYNIF